MNGHHPWKLVGPWYYWRRQIDARVASSPRGTRPALQKFDSSSFVDGFLREPQHSLKFSDDVDTVFNVNLVKAPLLSSGPFIGRSVSFYAPKEAGGSTPQKASLTPTGIRKLYLDTHKRYYLVVCELHCDAPGFPTVSREQVCQAGFVLRRRWLDYPKSREAEALALLKKIVATQSQIADLDEATPVKPSTARRRALNNQKLKASGLFAQKRAALIATLAEGRRALVDWKQNNGIVSIHEGWRPSNFDKIGSWEMVEEQPLQLAEDTFPLYPLYPDATRPDHDAQGKALYFGVVPTSSLDTDEHGVARFDDKNLYEIRCFVRRHHLDCPRSEKVPDCSGELIWSEPTEVYRLAPQFDLIGTSNRPVTIQMPNLAELAAQAASLPAGRFSSVKVVQPQSLKPSLVGNQVVGGTMGVGQICFFSIPLITLVALFVLNIFLPLVVLIFGLWFLLAFKFCIPPSFEINAGLQAELNAVGELGIDVDAEFSASLNLGFTPVDLHADLVSGLSGGIAANEGLAVTDLTAGLEASPGYANSPLTGLAATLKAHSEITDPDTAGPELVAALEYEPHISPSEVYP